MGIPGAVVLFLLFACCIISIMLKRKNEREEEEKVSLQKGREGRKKRERGGCAWGSLLFAACRVWKIKSHKSRVRHAPVSIRALGCSLRIHTHIHIYNNIIYMLLCIIYI